MVKFRSSRHPHEIAVVIAATLIGLLGLISGQDANPSVYGAFGLEWGRAFFASMSFFSAVTLYGITRDLIAGMLIERVGLLVVAVNFALYAVAIVSERGLPGLSGTILPVVLCGAHVWRAWQIGTDLHRLRMALREASD